MDLGTILNRLYLDYYENCSEALLDLGLVFKNCRRFNKNLEEDCRILGDTLREVLKKIFPHIYIKII